MLCYVISYTVGYLIVDIVISDGIVGEVLFWVLRQVLGAEMYSHAVHMAWVKVYNRMLSIIVPKAVALEVRRGASEEHDDRLQHHQLAMFPASAMKSTSFVFQHINHDDDDVFGEDDTTLLACEVKREELVAGCPFHRTSWSHHNIDDDDDEDDTLADHIRLPSPSHCCPLDIKK